MDLIFVKSGVITFVEVKTIANMDMLEYRLSYSQKQRLLRAREWFENHYQAPTEVMLAIHTRANEIMVFNVT